MRWLINYIRSCFCKHDWEMLTHQRVFNENGNIIGEKWIYRCKTCGYSKIYKSY